MNREFYAEFAQAFSETRSPARQNIEPIMPYLGDGVKILEVGCGNGRLVERLDSTGYHLSYIGLDVTPELVTLANARRAGLQNITAELRVADLADRGWPESVIAYGPFDLALALAVLHHFPGLELRRDLLREIKRLLRPGGMFVMSNWQFTRNERLRRKIVPWQTVQVDERDLEEGDALLDWKRGGHGYRYVHLLRRDEVEELARTSGFRVVDQFYADDDLNLWSVLKASAAPSPGTAPALPPAENPRNES